MQKKYRSLKEIRIYTDKEGCEVPTYQVTLRMGTESEEILIKKQGDDLKKVWKKSLEAANRHLRKLKERGQYKFVPLKHLLFLTIIFPLFIFSCEEPQKVEATTTASIEDRKMYIDLKPLKEKVLSKAERDKMEPQEIINSFIAGNRRFIQNDLTIRDHTKQIREAAMGQFPKAVVLTCSDSRIPVEDVFDKGIGDLIVIRVAGNVINDDILADMEYACKEEGAKVIVVMGHDGCRAVRSSIKGNKTGNLASITMKLKNVIDQTKNIMGPRSTQNAQFVNEVIHNNIKNSVNKIKEDSPILKNMAQEGQIKIVGATYKMASGKVVFGSK